MAAPSGRKLLFISVTSMIRSGIQMPNFLANPSLFVYFLVASFCLAYLTMIAIPAGGAFLRVFRFTSTAAFLTFFAAMVPHAIWFKARIVGHLIESIAYAAIVGAIFAAMWPAAA